MIKITNLNKAQKMNKKKNNILILIIFLKNKLKIIFLIKITTNLQSRKIMLRIIMILQVIQNLL